MSRQHAFFVYYRNNDSSSRVSAYMAHSIAYRVCSDNMSMNCHHLQTNEYCYITKKRMKVSLCVLTTVGRCWSRIGVGCCWITGRRCGVSLFSTMITSVLTFCATSSPKTFSRSTSCLTSADPPGPFTNTTRLSSVTLILLATNRLTDSCDILSLCWHRLSRRCWLNSPKHAIVYNCSQ